MHSSDSSFNILRIVNNDCFRQSKSIVNKNELKHNCTEYMIYHIDFSNESICNWLSLAITYTEFSRWQSVSANEVSITYVIFVKTNHLCGLIHAF